MDELVGTSSETKEEEEAFIKFLENRKSKKRNRLEDSGDEIEVENYDDKNTMYLIDLYCGSEGQPVSVILDTGSSWTTVQSEDCSRCSGE